MHAFLQKKKKLMNQYGILKTVESDLTHAKHWSDVTIHDNSLTGTSPEYGTTTVYPIHYTHNPVILPECPSDHTTLLAIVAQDSSISYFRMFTGIEQSAVMPSKKDKCIH
jgi:hypothetical protein